MIYAENRSFDNLYGLFPGANGRPTRHRTNTLQVDHDGKPLPHLPPVWKGKAPDPAFPTDLPNRPFRIDAPPVNLPLSVATRDLVHRFYQNLEQIDGGKLDRFVEASDAGAPDHGLLRRIAAADVEMGAGIHARRQLFYRRVRRVVHEPLLADMRLHAGVSGRSAEHARAALDGQFLKRKAEFAGLRDQRSLRFSCSTAR